MLNTLRQPMVFLLLTLCLAGWIYGAAADRHDSHTLASRIQRGWAGPPNIASYTSFSASAPYFIALFEEPGGVAARRVPNYVVFTNPDEPRPFARITIDYSDLREYGLVLPVVERGTVVTAVTVLDNSSAMYTHADLLAAARAQQTLPAKHEYTWHIPNLLHDAALAAALLAWLVALLMIPAWRIWRRVTPAQRRGHACPNCRYDRSAAPDAPCPECGAAAAIT